MIWFEWDLGDHLVCHSVELCSPRSPPSHSNPKLPTQGGYQSIKEDAKSHYRLVLTRKMSTHMGHHNSDVQFFLMIHFQRGSEDLS